MVAASSVVTLEAGLGMAFGELALLYNAPRSATITAAEDSDRWKQKWVLGARVAAILETAVQHPELHAVRQECWLLLKVLHKPLKRTTEQLSGLLLSWILATRVGSQVEVFVTVESHSVKGAGEAFSQTVAFLRKCAIFQAPSSIRTKPPSLAPSRVRQTLRLVKIHWASET
eukprot:5874430-Amphidinium_carterae.1